MMSHNNKPHDPWHPARAEPGRHSLREMAMTQHLVIGPARNRDLQELWNKTGTTWNGSTVAQTKDHATIPGPGAVAEYCK